ncbi:hypothetical protein [Pseudomonas fluorescens]|uniref:hypothetical protein n=1 Tax=Pseudomonas fluorescens TaxID=294 RepID=UPI0034A01E8C
MAFPLPSYIAKKLEKRSFYSFDDFSQAFWLAIAEDPVTPNNSLPRNSTASRKAGHLAHPSAKPQKACATTRSATSTHPPLAVRRTTPRTCGS